MIKYFERLLEKPIIASGKTRFLVTIAGIASETYMARYCPVEGYTELAMYSVAVIALSFIVLKTGYDVYVVYKLPPGKMRPTTDTMEIQQR
jgi:hypothetical protein